MSKEILFGDGKSKTVPDHVNNFEDVAKKLPDDLKYTPESVQEDKSLRDQLPIPTGYRLMILPFVQKLGLKPYVLICQ